MAQTVHVLPDPQGGWLVKRDSAASDAGHFDAKALALEAGRQLARELGAELVVHYADGREERIPAWQVGREKS